MVLVVHVSLYYYTCTTYTSTADDASANAEGVITTLRIACNCENFSFPNQNLTRAFCNLN